VRKEGSERQEDAIARRPEWDVRLMTRQTLARRRYPSPLPPKLTLMSSLASAAAAPSPHHDDDDDIKLIGSRQWPIEDYGNVKVEGGLQGVCITKRPTRWG